MRRLRSCATQDQASRLQELLDRDDAALDKYLEPRHVIDLFLEFPAARPPPSKVCLPCFAQHSTFSMAAAAPMHKRVVLQGNADSRLSKHAVQVL